MCTIHTISSSDNEKEEELDLISRLNKKYGHQIDSKSEKNECSTEDALIHASENGNLKNAPDLHHDCSDDDLPDIEDVSLLPAPNHLSYPVDTSPVHVSGVITSSVASSTSSSSVDLDNRDKKQIEKEARRKEREAKKEEKERLKKQKQDERMMKKATKPGECHKYLLVKIDRKLLELAEGSEIISKLLSMDVRYEAIEQRIPYAVTFYRQEPLTDSEQNEKEAVIIIPIEDFLPQVYNQIYGENAVGSTSDTLCSNCFRWKALTEGASVTVVVCGLDDYYRKTTSKIRKEFRENILSEGESSVSGKARKRKKNEDSFSTKVSRIDVETALIAAQIEEGINVRLVANPTKVSDFICQVTKAIAERPYKLNKMCNEFTWYAEGSNNNCVKIDKSGVGLLKLWHQQLRQFSNVGVETAQAIAKDYPSPQSLIQAYRSLPACDAMKLLADIPVRRGVGVLTNTRKVGIELSKKIYRFFTEIDAAVYL